jgi:nucleoside-diphosphate-sugar epimerase
MKILITGGAGYLGTKLTEMLLEQDRSIEITAVDNFYHNNSQVILPFLTNPRYSFHKLDLLDTENYKTFQKYDAVIHLAALVGFPICEDHKLYATSINLDSVKHIIHNIRKDCLLIYPTTNSGYGTTSGDSACTEETPLNPVSLYGITKKQAEEYIAATHENSVRLRLATVFGSSYRLRNDLLVNSFVWKAYKDKYNVIYDGTAMRNYIHISDVCQAMIFTLQHRDKMRGQVYNVGNDSLNMSKLDLAYKIHQYLPHKIVEGQVGVDMDKRNYIVSSQKIYNLGFNCRFTLDYGIKELMKVYKAVDVPIFGNY